MNKRIAMAVAAGTAVALPLLAACGSSTTPESSSAAPSASAAATSATTASTPSASPASASPSPTASASASADPAQQKKEVQAASEKFTKTVLSIGYPDKTYDAYLARLKPLMTKAGYEELDTSSKSSDAPKSVKKLYAQKTRSSPRLIGDVKVSAVDATSATSKLSYQNRIQQRVGGGYTTVKTSPKQTVTLSLEHEDGRWLVDSAQ